MLTVFFLKWVSGVAMIFDGIITFCSFGVISPKTALMVATALARQRSELAMRQLPDRPRSPETF